MKRILLVLVREYLENVRTRAFLIGLILTPVWMGLVFVVPRLARDTVKTEDVVVLDETRLLGPAFTAALEQVQTADGTPRFRPQPGEKGEEALAHLKTLAGKGDLFIVVLGAGLVDTKRAALPGEEPTMVYGSSGVGALETGRVIQAVVDQVANQHLVASRRVEPEVAQALLRPAAAYTPLTATGERGGAAQIMAPFLAMMMLFLGIVGISQMLISSTLEEKASRVYEVLLSSLSPFQLMAGKVLGICAVGFTLLLLWSTGGLVAAALQGLGGLVTGAQVGLFAAYYVLGFLLIASLMVSVGSACNTLKEAQNLMAPVSLLLALPLLLAIVVMKDPNGSLATGLSFVPPFTPFLMMARIASSPPPPTWQIVASLALLAVSTVIAIRLAARIFRVGILMYGQPPKLKEIWRWMRTP